MNIENPARAWNRYIETLDRNRHTADSREVDLFQVMKYQGKTVIDFSKLPDIVKRLAKKDIMRGYSTGRNGNIPYYAALACELCPKPFPLGFAAKTHMELYVPAEISHEVYDGLSALGGLLDKVNGDKFRMLGANNFPGFCIISYYGWNAREASIFKEIKSFLAPFMDRWAERRFVACDMLESGKDERVFAFFDRK